MDDIELTRVEYGLARLKILKRGSQYWRGKGMLKEEGEGGGGGGACT